MNRRMTCLPSVTRGLQFPPQWVWRAAINRWTLVRTPDGWRIAERFNRALDGSADSHDTMRKVLG